MSRPLSLTQSPRTHGCCWSVNPSTLTPSQEMRSWQDSTVSIPASPRAPNVTFVDAGAAVENSDGTFAKCLPCLPGETECGRSGATSSRHTIMYLGNPAIGARGLDAAIVTAFGGAPRFHKANLIPQTADLLAA
jgi:hypothetical protein